MANGHITALKGIRFHRRRGLDAWFIGITDGSSGAIAAILLSATPRIPSASTFLSLLGRHHSNRVPVHHHQLFALAFDIELPKVPQSLPRDGTKNVHLKGF